MAAPAASQAAIERAIAAAKAQGLVVSSFSVSRDGTVSIRAAEALDMPMDQRQADKPKQWAKR